MPSSVSEKKPSRQGKMLTIMVMVVCVTGFIICVAVGLYPLWYQGKIYTGVRVAGVALGGLSREEARAHLQQAVDTFGRQGVELQGFGHAFTLLPTVSALEGPDLAYELVRYDIDAMVDEAMAVGRRAPQGNARAWTVNALTAVGVRIAAVDLPARYSIDGARVLALIGNEFGRFESPAQNATLTVDSEGKAHFAAERMGERIDISRASADLASALTRFSPGPVVLTLGDDQPLVVAAQVQELLPEVDAALARAPYLISFSPETRALLEKERGLGASAQIPEAQEVSQDTLASWLTVVPVSQGGARLGLDYRAVKDFLILFAQWADRPATDAKFEIRNGKVVEFQGSRDGRAVDMDATHARMEGAFLSEGNSRAFIVLNETRAKVRTADVNDLGITELLGVGRSNFSGSPQNRRHNIGVGVASVNGTLIAPGEEFSLLHTLGEIEARTGYLPELVIKGSRTVPEYGGGLCQIGTTAFRTALSAGVPIVERQNHSYRVRYYEPAGTDATIYNPKPDFRFLNDTRSSLLFQARVEGDDVIFELWGTSDGRVATTTTPVVYNIVSPPPTKIVETTDLAPGQKRCTETPHSGADASFTYTVMYRDGRVEEEEFKSHYRPWQEVCLVGVEKIEEEREDVQGE